MYFVAEQFEFEFVKELKTPADDNIQLSPQNHTHLKMGANENSLEVTINKWACSIREASASNYLDTAKPVKSTTTRVERPPYFGSARGLSCGKRARRRFGLRIKDKAKAKVASARDI